MPSSVSNEQLVMPLTGSKTTAASDTDPVQSDDHTEKPSAVSVIPDDFYAKNKSPIAAASQRTQSSQPATANPTQEPSATTTTQPGASRELFAFDCEEANGHEKEEVRLARWKQEDPISLQEAYVTSNAFLKACRDNDVDEVHEIVNHAVYTDFLQYQVIQGYYACVQHLNFPLFRDVFDHQGFPAQLFPEIPHAVAELCGKENFTECRKFLKALFTGFQIPVDHPRHRDGMTPLCISCLRGCLPLSIVLLEEYHASCHVITKNNLVPYQYNAQPQPSDDELATEGRQLLKNRFDCFQVGKDAQEVLRKLRTAPAGKKIQYTSWAGSCDL